MINKILWSDDFLVGIPEVDEQHKKLVSFIGDFYEILIAGESQYISKREAILKEIVDYTVYHFGTEEKLFELHNYPEAPIHMSQHRTFISEVSRQVDNLLLADITHGQVFYGFLVTWLLSHIAKADKSFARVIQKQ